ncbi:PAS domain S-box protein [Paraflavisolibacter sp. H34]|uniref:PAS domain-containing sensor histidine kinase n=1 Tax=Huijunlia imazamoxiresistens TaxID=3127457 RepID=UPI0030170AC0
MLPSLDALAVLNALPGAYLILLPDPPRYTIVAASDPYLKATFLDRETALGRPLFETNTDDPANADATGVKNLLTSLHFVLEHKKEHRMADQRYDICNPATGKFELRVWRPRNIPVLDEAGSVRYIIHAVEDITDTVQLQEAQQASNRKLGESEEKYRGISLSMDQGFCLIKLIFDAAGKPVDYRFLETNPLFEQQTGLKDVIGKTALELVPNLEDHWFELYGAVARTGNPIRFEQESQAMGRWFEVSAFRIGKEQQNVALLFSDITERKKAGEAIAQSENNLRNIILQAPVAMGIVKGPSFILELANDRLYELWGRGPEELLHKPIFEARPEARNQGLEELLTGVYTTGETYSAYGRPVILPRNGCLQTVYINMLYEAFREGNGSISGVVVVASDVTDQVVAKMKVEEHNRELQFVMDVMPHLMWSAQANGFADFFNKVCRDYTGLSMQELTGDGWANLVHPEDAAATEQAWRRALTGIASQHTVVHRLRGKDGVYRWFLTQAIPLKDEKGSILKWFGTSTNIEHQKASEETLEQRVRERTEELERKNKELQQFAYISHHDLQEPLRKILLFGDMVTGQGEDSLSEPLRSRLDKILASAFRMSEVLRDVLDFASLDKEEAFVATDLGEILTAVQTDLEGVIAAKGARILSGKLPVLKAVPHQMHQLFYNLLANALKFSTPGRPPLVIISCQGPAASGLQAEGDKPSYLITVADNGIGFSQESAEKIFDIFQRLHSKEAYSGTGIGLALCKKVVGNHFGKIWAEGSPGEGAIFKVLLPAE